MLVTNISYTQSGIKARIKRPKTQISRTMTYSKTPLGIWILVFGPDSYRD